MFSLRRWAGMQEEFGIDIIKDYVGRENFIKGRNYFPFYVRYIGDSQTKEETLYFFRVNSEREPINYSVKILMRDKEIVESTCTCPQYGIEGCCKHIAASLYNYREELFPISEEEKKLMLSKSLLEEMYSNRAIRKPGVRKQVHIDVCVEFISHSSEMKLKLRIGESKLYSLNSKITTFLNAYKDNRECQLGKDFTYSPDLNYFSKEDKDIIEFLVEYDRRTYYSIRELCLTRDDIRSFLKLCASKVIGLEVRSERGKVVNGRYQREEEHFAGVITSIKEGNPFEMTISKEGEFYLLKSDVQLKKLTDDCKYAYISSNDRREGTLYFVPQKVSELTSFMLSNELDGLSFRSEDLEMFKEGVLPLIKENIVVDESVGDEIIIASKPDAKLYFDFKRDIIILNVKFSYDGNELDYFEESSNIVRDVEVEQSVVSDMLEYGFIESENKFYLEDMDEIGEFLEVGLEELASKYEVFTSSKIKNTNFLKDNKIRSSFSIGKDNILRYEFDFGNIKTDEIVDILETLKRKKKYYKLKSGDFLNLENNDDLLELERLIDEMDLRDGDIRNGTGEIPKYRAVYLDSLKKDKYHIIKTDNLFDELIEKFNSFKDVDVEFSSQDKNTLRDYQQTGVKWLYNIYKCGFGGILADEMGLGKSIQLICFIKEILKEKKDAKILIVAPTSLIYNWKNEFDKFGREIAYKVIAENKNTRKQELEHLDGVNVLITTYGLVRRDKETYDEMVFELVAIDEAQNIKNTNAQMTKVVKSLKATTKVALTGTPLENSVMELWSIFDFIMPGYLASLISFQRKYNIKDVDEKNLDHLKSLNKQIAPFIMRRRKKDVVQELPDKIENNIFIDLNDEQKKLYAAQLEKTKKELDDIIEEGGIEKANFKILQLLMKLRQLCIDPAIVYENYKGGSSKIENLVSIVKDIIQNGHKILLFTSFKTALDIVNREFTNNNISTYVIDGSVSSKRRMELVDKFNEDETNVFLITLKSGGTGLNLTSADVVIHLDLWWNPQVENQATDRAHRIGQKKTVEVIRLICKGTIEERILELQNKKKVLSDALIEGENRDINLISKLTEEDIKNLLYLDNEE